MVVSSDCQLVSVVRLEADLVIPDGVKHIPESFFRSEEISSITFPQGLVSIGRDAFYNACEKLKEIRFPDSLQIIEEGAFETFVPAEVESLTFPEGVAQIGKNAFKRWDKLTSITFKGGPLVFEAPFKDCSNIACVTFETEVGAALKYFKGARFKGITLNTPKKK